MDIVELVQKIGQENINFQVLDQCITHAKKGRDGTMVTFGCDVPIADLGMLGPAKRRALILWVDAEKIKEAMKP
jgi:hypothetical protein